MHMERGGVVVKYYVRPPKGDRGITLPQSIDLYRLTSVLVPVASREYYFYLNSRAPTRVLSLKKKLHTYHINLI